MKPLSGHLTPVQLAKRWDMSEGTLANWRIDKKGPKWVRRFGRIWYPLERVTAFERKHGLGAS
jgi:hypothetical protein